MKLRETLNRLQPQLGYNDYVKDIKEGIKLTKMVSQRNYLDKLRASGEAVPEVQTLARRRVSTNPGNRKRYKAEERRIMLFRIREKEDQIKKQRETWKKQSKRCEGSFQPDGKLEYKLIKKGEVNRVWALEKWHKDRKLNRYPGTPENYQGILLGDSSLQEEFGEMQVKPIILGNIQASDNMKAFCSLPLKYRLFPRVGKKGSKVETESRGAKQRWSLSDIKNHPGETFGERANRLESENWEREPDKGDGRVDFTGVRVTQLAYNKMIHMPEAGAWAEEVVIQRQQLEALEVIDNYILSDCDESGLPFGGLNLTKAEDLGRKEILRGVKSKKYMLYGTDKSEQIVLDTYDNFMLAMEPHIRDHIRVTLDDVENSEKLMNNHSKMWCKTTKIGQNAGRAQHERIIQASQVHSSSVPQYKGLRKDHKPPDPIFGPPLRVLADGKKGPNAPAANLQAQVLRPVRSSLNRKIQTEIVSTEEACYHFSKFNEKVRAMPDVRRQPKRGNKPPPCSLIHI